MIYQNVPQEEKDYKRLGTEQTIQDKSYTDILREYNNYSTQKNVRINFLKEIEKLEVPAKKTVGVIAFICDESSIHSSMNSRDIPAIGSALMSIGQVDILRLVINSPGGDGTIAEKIIEMCKCYCKRFEVIIPNMAKSAATMIALGSDEIVMGYCSEIGPIDAQVPIIVGNVPRYISAQSFIDSRRKLIKEYEQAVKDKKDTKLILQQIATLDLPFIEECEKYMNFSKDMADKCLTKYMFKKYSRTKNSALLRSKIDKALKYLSSTEDLYVHGRMVNTHTAKTVLGLSIKSLGRDSIYWKKIWEYYVRANITLGRIKSVKLIETKGETLHAG